MGLRSEWNLLKAAVMCYTRLPAGEVHFDAETAHEAARYMPLVGALIGGCGAAVYALAFFLLHLPPSVSSVLALSTMIVVTGAFHEDGFSDFLDGFGGGTSRERVLEIMKDSHAGAFGMIGTVMQLLLKVCCLSALTSPIPAMVVMCCSARSVPLLMMHFSVYARRENSKLSRESYVTSDGSIVVGVVTGLVALLVLGWVQALAVVAVYVLLFLFVHRLSKVCIGGYTGDVLVALEQMCEMGCLVALIAVERLM